MKFPSALTFAFFAAGLLYAPSLSASDHKIRIAISGGPELVNEIGAAPGAQVGASLTLAYPVSPKTRIVNSELGIITAFRHGLGDVPLNLIVFGFSIRVLVNEIEGFRPYFTHDVTTRILYRGDRENYAVTYGVNLGLGFELALEKLPREQEAPSLFFDLSYDFYDLVFFESDLGANKTLLFCAGLSLPF